MELLISMAILTLVATGVLAINALPRRKALDLEDRMKASLALERKLNDLRRQDFSSLTDGTSPAESVPGLSGGTLTYTLTTPDVLQPDWKDVYLSIAWTDRGGAVRTQDAVSSLYDHGG